jgi:putative transposase
MIQKGHSERSACDAADLWRSTFQYEPARPDPCRKRIRSCVVRLSRKHRRLGYRKITVIARRSGQRINPKRVQRIRRLEGLALPRRRPRKRHVGPVWERPRTATHRNHVWTVDFTFDLTEYGTRLKMLTVVDEYTRECLSIRVEKRIDSELVIETMAKLIARRGAPGYIRSDNGPEFIAEKLRRWLAAKGTRTVYIDPGSPWQNGFIESFNGQLKSECVNAELFWSRGEAQVIVEQWRRWYNEGRPHGSLGYRTPAEVGACPAGPSSSPDSAPQGMRLNGVPD